jgi:hypothetical protein
MEEDVLAGAQDANHRSAEPVPNRYPGEDAGQPVPAHLGVAQRREDRPGHRGGKREHDRLHGGGSGRARNVVTGQ